MKVLVLGLLLLAYAGLMTHAQPQCGSQANGAVCPNNLCCSQYGYCGLGGDYCVAITARVALATSFLLSATASSRVCGTDWKKVCLVRVHAALVYLQRNKGAAIYTMIISTY
ncbi:hypothetical protein HU200_061395 [Digitaria exilis]|uniref:Chitin-binding type-1 domain-containing protein n=1 Tax=Digitaria exilis TaxID=1010633 RepID=A0A835A7X2_9POAL|nr:hypothetical protein HU200_061395 [Digitaria exilis]